MDLDNFCFTPHALAHSAQAYGYIQCTCPDDLRPTILQASEAADQPHQQELVGQIQEEYLLPSLGDDVGWNEFLKCAAMAHESSYPGYWSQLKKLSGAMAGLHPSLPWVNHMQKHEYNPMHIHSGVLSYVLWVNVPFQIEDERRVCASAKDNEAASFAFVISGPMGVDQICLPVDQSWEWEMVMFPAQLHHLVYPFQTSDQARVSIAGNVHLAA